MRIIISSSIQTIYILQKIDITVDYFLAFKIMMANLSALYHVIIVN